MINHWGRMTHVWIGNLTIIGSDNGLSPGRRQPIIWTNVGILLIGDLEANFSDILIEIHTLSFENMHLKMSSGKYCPFCLGLNVSSNFIQPSLINVPFSAITTWLNFFGECIIISRRSPSHLTKPTTCCGTHNYNYIMANVHSKINCHMCQ